LSFRASSRISNFDMQITARIEDRVVRQSLHRLGDALPNIGRRRLKSVMTDSKYEASGRYSGGASYSVPPPTGSTYIRTGDYGSSFYLVQNEGVSYTLHADSDHARYVGGMADGTGQAAIHIGRWPNIAATVRSFLQTLTTEIEQDISAMLRSMGIGL